MGRIWRLIWYAFLSAVLGLIVTGAIGTALLKQPFLLAPIRSNSMYPLLERGDAVFIRPFVQDKVSVGDIIVFHADRGKLALQGWVIHRVVGGDEAKGFITKGDANTYTDQESGGAQVIKTGSIAARALTVASRPVRVRLLGYPSLWMEQYSKSSSTLPVSLGAVSLLLIVTELKCRGRYSRRPKTTPAYIIYPAAGLAICLLLVSTQITASSFFTVNYQVSPSQRGVMIGSPVGVMQQGDSVTRDIAEVGGNGFFPMVVSVTSKDPQFVFNKELMLTKPGVKEKLFFNIEANQVGNYRSTVCIGLFIPILPPLLIHHLAGIDYWLALGVVSVIPALPLILWPILNSRLRRIVARSTRQQLSRMLNNLYHRLQ